jgi:hypothetical protein
VWATQRIRKGWWDLPEANAKRAVEAEMRLAMERLARRFNR